MALIVEDGTGKTDSDTYASEAALAAYAAARGVTIAGTDTELLITAMDYLESKDFKGDKGTQEQALQWPRLNVVIDRLNVVIDGYYVDSDAIPQSLVDAQCEIAISIDGGTNPLAIIGRDTKSEKVGDIEVTYMDSAASRSYLTAAETKLDKLVKSKTGAFRV